MAVRIGGAKLCRSGGARRPPPVAETGRSKPGKQRSIPSELANEGKQLLRTEGGNHEVRSSGTLPHGVTGSAKTRVTEVTEVTGDWGDRPCED